MANSKKLLPSLLVVGGVLLIGAIVVICRKHDRPPESAVVIEPMVTEPVVFEHAVTFAESRRWGDEVPHGTQVLDNVTFVCDGALRTAGMRNRRAPGAVVGIPVSRKGTRIHLLQAAENSPGNSIGDFYGRLRFHFSDGQSRDFYLRFGVHGRDWFQLTQQLQEGVSDPNTGVAWVAKNDARKVWIRLFHTALDNPFPNEEIITVDAISPLGGGNLLLFAVSVDNSPVKLPPPVEEAASPEWLSLDFSLQNSNHAPLPGGTVRWKALLDKGVVDFPPLACDAAGRLSLDFATRAITEIRYTAADQQGATATGTLRRPDTGWAATQRVDVVFANAKPSP